MRKKCDIGPDPKGEWKCELETSNPKGICNGCIAGGWTGDPQEIAVAIANDPVLSKKVPIVSPIQNL